MRLTAIVAGLVLVAGCGSGAGGGDGARLGFAVATTSEDFAQRMADGGKYAAATFDGVELRVSGSDVHTYVGNDNVGIGPTSRCSARSRRRSSRR